MCLSLAAARKYVPIVCNIYMCLFVAISMRLIRTCAIFRIQIPESLKMLCSVRVTGRVDISEINGSESLLHVSVKNYTWSRVLSKVTISARGYNPALFANLHEKTETMTVLLHAFRCRSSSSVCRIQGSLESGASAHAIFVTREHKSTKLIW